MNSAVDTTASTHGVVRGVDNRVHVLRRDVPKNGGDDWHAAQYAYEHRPHHPAQRQRRGGERWAAQGAHG
jgi:hypothetical protein